MSTPVRGAVAQGALPPLLRDLYLGRCTGLLHFERAGDSGSVCFIKGHIAWGQSSIEECRLGPVLVRHGLVGQESIDQAYEIVGGGRRLGDVLLDCGALDRETLDQALALQVRETLLAVFAWPDGSWRFEAHPDAFFKGYDQALRVSTGDLIMDAVWSVADPAAITYALGDLDRAVALTTDPLLRFQRIALTEMDGFLVSLADGVRTGAEMLALVPNDPQEAQRSLFGLLCTGLLETVEGAPAEPEEMPLSRDEVLETHRALPTRDHFEVLGLTRAATTDQVRDAFIRLARRFHPDVQHQPDLAGLGRPIEEIFTRLADADRVLGVPPRRAEYERRLALSEVQTLLHSAPPSAPPAAAVPPEAMPTPEEMVARAEREQQAGNHWDALTAVDAVVGGLSGRLRRRAWLVRARALAENPKWRKQAEEQIQQLLAEDPASPEALFVLGRIYQAGGLATRAAATFKRVLELKPRHAGARAALGG